MSATAEDQAELDRRIEDLRGFEREYRGRLREHLTSLLNDLNDVDLDLAERPRQEIIGPEWSLIVPGLEIRANGNGTRGRVCIELRTVQP